MRSHIDCRRSAISLSIKRNHSDKLRLNSRVEVLKCEFLVNVHMDLNRFAGYVQNYRALGFSLGG